MIEVERSAHVKYHRGRLGRTLKPLSGGETFDGGLGHDRIPERIERIIADVEHFQRRLDHRVLTESDNSEWGRLLRRMEERVEGRNSAGPPYLTAQCGHIAQAAFNFGIRF